MQAADLGHENCVLELVKLRADVSARDRQGKRPEELTTVESIIKILQVIHPSLKFWWEPKIIEPNRELEKFHQDAPARERRLAPRVDVSSQRNGPALQQMNRLIITTGDTSDVDGFLAWLK